MWALEFHLLDIIIILLQDLFDFLKSFVPLLQNFQRVKSNLEQPIFGIRVRSSKPDHTEAGRRRVLYVRSL